MENRNLSTNDHVLSVRCHVEVDLTSVQARIDELKRESDRYGVERDLFLCGSFKHKIPIIEGYINPIDIYHQSLIVTDDSLAKQIQQSLKRPKFLRTIRSIFDHDLYQLGSFYFEDGSGIEKFTTENLDSIQTIYAPTMILRDNPWDREEYPDLVSSGVIGYFHTHPSSNDELLLSQGDVGEMMVMKNLMEKNKFLAGIGNTSQKEKFYVI